MRERGPELTNSCVAECSLTPPALFDLAASLAPMRGAHTAGQATERAIPPGSTCEDWELLQPLTKAQCQRRGHVGLRRSTNAELLARWEDKANAAFDRLGLSIA